MFHTLVVPEIAICLIIISTCIFVADVIRFSLLLFEKKKRHETFEGTANKIKKSALVALGIISCLCIVYSYSYYFHYNTMIKTYEAEKQCEHDATDYDWIQMNDNYQHEIYEQLEKEEITYQESRFLLYGNVDKITMRQILFPSKFCLRTMIFSLYYTIVAGCLFAIYIKPTKSAFENNHPQKNTILWLNILTGWTLIGWLVLLMWMNPGGAVQQIPASPSVQIPATQPKKRMSVADQLIALKNLRDDGIITQEEFEQKKQEVLHKV